MRIFRNIIDMSSKIILWILLLTSTALPVSAQEDGAYQLPGYKDRFLNPVAPDVWSMIKYGNAEVNPYSGTVGTSIPIYTYQDDDFTIPISIDYASSGYKPNIPTGVVGLGWYLNVGGAITREVRGIPDDGFTTLDFALHGLNPKFLDTYGYAHLCKEFENIPAYISVRYTNIPGKDYIYACAETYAPMRCFEREPDIYHFNFMGHSGSFILQPGGRALFYGCNHPAGEYSLSFEIAPGNEEFGAFTIRTGDGTKYHFERGDKCKAIRELDGLRQTFDYSNPDTPGVPKNHDFKESDDQLYTTSSWRLACIEAPNGRTAEFAYGQERTSTCIPTVSSMDEETMFLKNIGTNYTPRFVTESQTDCKQYQPTVNLVFAGYVESITIDGALSVEFRYSDKPSERLEFFPMLYGYESSMKRLNTIRIRDSVGHEIKTCNCSYRLDSDNSTKGVTFLKSVAISGEGSYSMSYIDEDKVFPGIDTYAIDWYGYYNGSEETTYSLDSLLNAFIPSDNVVSDILTNKTHILSYRKPSVAHAAYGMLKRIGYPTGGYTTYEYEGNSWGKIGYLLEDYEERVRSLDKKTGGLRIKTVCDYYENNSLKQKRAYSYSEKSNPDNSTGQLLWVPNFYKEYQYSIYYSANQGLPFKEIFRKTYRGRSSSDDRVYAKQNHIEYPRVVETLYDEYAQVKSLIEYNYNSALSVMCYDDILENMPEDQNWKYMCTYSRDAKFTDSDKYTASLLGGKLLSKKYYDRDLEHLLYEETYHYKSYKGSPASLTVPIIYDAISCDYTYRFTTPFLSELTTCVYNENSELIKSSFRKDSVNTKGQLVTRIASDSKGGEIVEKYNYHDVVPAYLTNKIVLNKNKVVSAVRYDYLKKHEGFYVPSAVKRAEIKPTATESNLTYRVEMTVDRHDDLGHPLQITDKSGKKTCYVWGYKGLYPVAKIENATIDQVASRLSGYGAKPLLQYLSAEQESSLRTLSDAWITTYRYDPLVGITRIVDASGRSTDYDYDYIGRLTRIWDEKNMLMKSFDYNIITD